MAASILEDSEGNSSNHLLLPLGDSVVGSSHWGFFLHFRLIYHFSHSSSDTKVTPDWDWGHKAVKCLLNGKRKHTILFLTQRFILCKLLCLHQKSKTLGFVPNNQSIHDSREFWGMGINKQWSFGMKARNWISGTIIVKLQILVASSVGWTLLPLSWASEYMGYRTLCLYPRSWGCWACLTFFSEKTYLSIVLRIWGVTLSNQNSLTTHNTEMERKQD
jgi:hypothetical protein